MTVIMSGWLYEPAITSASYSSSAENTSPRPETYTNKHSPLSKYSTTAAYNPPGPHTEQYTTSIYFISIAYTFNLPMCLSPSKQYYYCWTEVHKFNNNNTVKPVQTKPQSNHADHSVFRGVRFSQCWVFSAMCLSFHAYIFMFTHKCTANIALLTFTYIYIFHYLILLI